MKKINTIEKLIDRLESIKKQILSNIKYDSKKKTIIYKNGVKLGVTNTIKELNNEFDNKLINDLNVINFVRKIKHILKLKN